MISNSKKRWQRLLLISSFLVVTNPFHADAFQIAPMGSRFEARLTNESEDRLARIAGRVGVLLKGPIHEEITQLGFGCPTDSSKLALDDSCKGGDIGFVNPYVIYGVRWNDLPPFRLSPGQGDQCKRLLSLGEKACNVQQTVRFATQPECWYCLFKEAERKAATKKITGCSKGEGYEQGNFMTRSHFGDLQFLHAMANEEGLAPEDTRKKILDWIQFAWRVFSREYGPDQLLRTIDIPTIKEQFGCSNWTVSDIYILGQQDKLRPRLDDIAFGSILHTVQDSFAGAHTNREVKEKPGNCPGSSFAQPGRIVEFHTYGAQDGGKHDVRDAREAMVISVAGDWPEVVVATKSLFELYNSNANWETAKPYIECVFALSPHARRSSPGDEFRRSQVAK